MAVNAHEVTTQVVIFIKYWGLFLRTIFAETFCGHFFADTYCGHFFADYCGLFLRIFFADLTCGHFLRTISYIKNYLYFFSIQQLLISVQVVILLLYKFRDQQSLVQQQHRQIIKNKYCQISNKLKCLYFSKSKNFFLNSSFQFLGLKKYLKFTIIFENIHVYSQTSIIRNP